MQDPPQGLPDDIILNGRQYTNVTLTEPATPGGNATNVTYSIIPDCIPKKIYEVSRCICICIQARIYIVCFYACARLSTPHTNE